VTDEADETWPSKELGAQAIQQAQGLRDSAKEGGLRFQGFCLGCQLRAKIYHFGTGSS